MKQDETAKSIKAGVPDVNVEVAKIITYGPFRAGG